MTLSFRGRFWRIVLGVIFKGKRLTIAENRTITAQSGQMMRKIPNDVQLQKIEINGIQAVWIRPTRANQDQVAIHLHGGGYVTGSIESHLMMCIPMAQTLKMAILLPEYRLAPEYPFPAALDDALSVYKWLLSQGFQPANIFISGDSAGGGLSLATVLALRNAGLPLPAGIVCISPWTDLTLKGKSHITNAKSETLLRTDILREWAHAYASPDNFENPLVSPLYADFHGFPPIFIQVGSNEILLDDATMLARKAQADGVFVDLKVWDSVWHAWPVLGNLIPESKQAFEQISQFVQMLVSMTKK